MSESQDLVVNIQLSSENGTVSGAAGYSSFRGFRADYSLSKNWTIEPISSDYLIL
jgi:hypothetical protein